MMRSRAQEQLTSKKSVIDKLHVEIAEHKHDVMLLRKQTEDVQKQQETLNEYLKALHPLLYNPKPLISSIMTSCTGVQEDERARSTQPLHSGTSAREIA
jgi:hypothetical protein